jgi:hypothetical protein
MHMISGGWSTDVVAHSSGHDKLRVTTLVRAFKRAARLYGPGLSR